MIKITVEKNDEKQRLDRFLKKYYGKASLSYIYKLIRKDIKLNGKRAKIDTMLSEGDILNIYISEEDSSKLKQSKTRVKAKKQFQVAYEDEDMLIVEKPYGLLTHGDSKEKKNTLANQVITYLIETGEFRPSREQTFKPAPVNRLDRNTTGLVIFGKNAEAVKRLNKAIKERNLIEKYYLTIVSGEMKEALVLKSKMKKDSATNKVHILGDGEEGKMMETIATPLQVTRGYTLVEVRLITGRTHQIRSHLAEAGFPVIGDSKYGNRKINNIVGRKYNLTTQLLHSNTLVFKGEDIKVESRQPETFKKIKDDIFGK